MKIRSSDLVLDLGSGDDPHPRANILCDRFVKDNRQRAGGFSIVIDRPLVVADARCLPFKNQAFDYIICRHLLEHLVDPERLIKELMRVGKAGYIETPSILAERFFGWDFHLWFVTSKNGTLLLQGKRKGVRFGGFFHKLIEKQIWFRRFFEENEDLFYTRYEWQGKIKIKVVKEIDQKEEQILKKIDWSRSKDLVFYFQWLTRRFKRKFNKEIRKALWQFKSQFQKQSILDFLLPLLVCPNCRAGVELGRGGKLIECPSCGKKYSLNGAIPIMLK